MLLVVSFFHITDGKQPSAPFFFVEVTYLFLFRSLVFVLNSSYLCFGRNFHLLQGKRILFSFPMSLPLFLTVVHPSFLSQVFSYSISYFSPNTFVVDPPENATTSTAYKIMDLSDKKFPFRFMIHPSGVRRVTNNRVNSRRATLLCAVMRTVVPSLTTVWTCPSHDLSHLTNSIRTYCFNEEI